MKNPKTKLCLIFKSYCQALGKDTVNHHKIRGDFDQ